MNHPPAAEAVVDLDAYRHNLTTLTRAAGPAQVMAVVKADAYGHGLQACARAARDHGVPWLGVATPDEALALRRTGDRGRTLCWLAAPGADFDGVLEQDVEVTASSVGQLEEIIAAAGRTGRRARVQLKVDTGLGRNGAHGADWTDLVAAAAVAQRRNQVEVTGVWSHYACADEPGHPSILAQERVFDEAVALVRDAGLEPEVCHHANSAATLTRPGARYDLVRVGIATYGLTPAPAVASAAEFDLRPAMTLRARLAAVKRVPAGTGVSYGHTFVTERETTLGLVPIGYGDGIIRALSDKAFAFAGGEQRKFAGRVCMDQVVIDLGDSAAERGDVVTMFGSGEAGEPTAQDWAETAGTISYEVVTRLGGRIRRTYVGER